MSEKRKHRFVMMLSAAELDAVDDWRYANRITTRARAVRLLIAQAVGDTDAINLALHAAASQEREACARLAEDRAPATQDTLSDHVAEACEGIAAAIRARGAP